MSSPRHSTPVSARGRSILSAKRCSRPCASASAGTSRVKSPLTPHQSQKIRSVAQQCRKPPSSTMDDRTTLIPQAAQAVQSPPRRQPKPADPCAMVIFGATGDLTKRLVMPALYNLSRTKMLPEHFSLIGVARTEGTVESWRGHLHDTLKSFVGNAAAEFDLDHIDEAAWQWLAEKMVYVRGDLAKPELYGKLRSALAE